MEACLYFYLIWGLRLVTIILLILSRVIRKVGRKRSGKPREKTPMTWLVSHVTRAGLEPTAVKGRAINNRALKISVLYSHSAIGGA